MPALAFPFINGKLHSWASIAIMGAGIPLPGIKSINYKDGAPPGQPRGQGQVPLGITAGEWSGSADIEMYRNEWEIFRLSPALGPGFYGKVFPLQVQYFEPGQPVIEDTLPAVCITDVDSSNATGTDGSTVKLTLMVIQPILWNGIPGTLLAI